LGVADSSSTAITSFDGERLTGCGGLRVDFAIDDGSLLPEVLQRLHDLCWARGYGWGFVSKGGSILERSLVDLALTRPHQPDYAAPSLKGCKSDRTFSEYPGGILSVDAIPSLSNEEIKAASTNRKKMCVDLAPFVKSAKADVKERVKSEILDRNPDAAASAKCAAARLLDGVVFGDMPVTFENNVVVSADDLVIDGAEYDGMCCLDPVEPDYDGGRLVGKFFWNDGGNPKLSSFAHGDTVYHLRLGTDRLQQMLENFDGDRREPIRWLALVEGNTSDCGAAECAVAKALGLGNRVKAVRSDVTSFRNEADIRPIAKAVDKAPAEGHGTALNCPLSGVEWPVTQTDAAT
jgi:hypothetical protein